MKQRGFMGAAAAVAVAIATIGAAAPAAAAPPTAPWGGSAGASVASLTTTAVGLNLAGLGVAVSEADAGSTLAPRASAVSSNVDADVAGLGITVSSNSQTAPPDAGGPTTGALVGVTVPTLLDIGALTTSDEANWDTDAACVTDDALASAATETAGLSLLPLLGGGVLDLGVSNSQGETNLVANSGLNHGVQSVASGQVSGLSLLGGAITIDVVGTTTLTATATGTSPGTVTYVPSVVTVTWPTGSQTLTLGDPTVDITLPLVADVSITLNSPTITTTATSAAASVSLLSIDVSVLGVFPLPPVAEVAVDVLPLTASASAPAGGIDCPPDPPVISDPTEGETTSAEPTIAGTAEPNATVEVFVDGASIGTTTADGLGNWAMPVPTPLSGGAHTASAIQTVAGTPSEPSAVVNFVVDATAPPAPVISSPVDGALLGDSTPTISGTAEANTTIEVFIDGSSIGTAPVDGSGNWSLTPATPLVDGPHSAVARATDAVGNVSPPSNTVTFTIDASPPPAPVITQPANGDVTSDDTPLIAGTAEPNSTVTVFIDGSAAGTTTADGLGAWSFTPAVPLADGPHTTMARATDAAGNVSPDSNVVAFEVDTAAPAAPVITSPANGSSTSDTTPPVTGTAEPNSTVEVFIDGASVGTTLTDGLGNWTFQTTTPLAEGERTVVATATDEAGNTGPASAPVTFTVDVTDPVPPVITSPANGSTIPDSTPDIVGSAEPNATVEVFIDGASIGTTTASGTGAWVLPVTTPLPPGSHSAVATATDAAGNESGPSNTVTFVVDVTPPPAPVITAPVDGSTITDRTPDIVGTAEPNATVIVVIDGTPAGTADVDGTGDWTFPVGAPLPDGPHSVEAVAVDAAGNISPPSNEVNFTVDATAPVAPVITAPADGSTITVSTPTISGTGESGSTVTVIVDGTELGTAVVDGAGDWTFPVPAPLPDGPHTVVAVAEDAAGNTSPPSNEVDFTIDTTAPAAPVITQPVDGSSTNDTTPLITGTAEPGAQVTVIIDGTPVGTVTASLSGAWQFQTLTPLTEGDHAVVATATDGAGHVSPNSNEVGFSIDLTAPAAPVITSPADGSSTTDPTPPITGTGEPGTEVTVIIDGRPVGTAPVDQNGNWQFQPTSPLTPGEHVITAEATDPAGNTGPESEPVTVTITVAPNGGGSGTGSLPLTGGSLPLSTIAMSALLMALGVGLLVARRRRV